VGGKDGKRSQKRGGAAASTKATVAKQFVSQILDDKSAGGSSGEVAGQRQVAKPEGAAGKGNKGAPAKGAGEGGGTGGGELPVAARSSKAGKEPKQNYVPPGGRGGLRVEAVSDGSKAPKDADKPGNKAASNPPPESKGKASKDASAAGKIPTNSTPQAAKGEPVPDRCAPEGTSLDEASTSARTQGQRPRGGRGRARDSVGSGPTFAVASEGN